MASFIHLLDQRRLIGPGGSTVSGEIYFYYTGTSVKAPIYLDAAMTVPSPNPVVVAAGQIIPLIFLDESIQYRRSIVYSDGSTDEQDPLGTLFSEGELGLPVGSIIDFSGTTAPEGFLLCSGQAVSRTEYPDLFGAIGVIYGSGNGVTTFNLPDYRGRVSAGKDNMGGTAASRLTSPVDGLILGDSGGEQSHTLLTTEMPSHNHTITDPGHTHTYDKVVSPAGSYMDSGTGSTLTSTASGSSTTGITLAAAGGGGAHNNVQPTIVVNKIIKATPVTFLSLLEVFPEFASKANAEAIGISPDDTDLGSFTGVTIADGSTVKAALQSLETKVEYIDDSLPVTAQDFGAVGDGVTNNDAAFVAIRNWLASRSYAGNSARIDFLPGRYVYTQEINWAITNAHIHFRGEVWMINTGPSNSFILDGGATGDGVYGLKITGKPIIYGHSGGLNGVYARSLFNSEIDINVKGAGTAYAGFYGEWLVDCDINFNMSSNEGGLYATPSKGLFLTSRGANHECSYNKITARISGMATGVYLDGALGNTFICGSVQNTTTGFQTTVNSWENEIHKMDFESNTTDIVDDSRRLLIIGCDMNTKTKYTSNASGGRILGGRSESIEIQSGAKGIVLSTSYNRTGSGTITSAGTDIKYQDVWDITAQSFFNDNTPLTPEMFGAVGDGVADDTVALQAMLDDAMTTKRIILMPPKRYKVTASLLVTEEVRWIGSGDSEDGTVLVNAIGNPALAVINVYSGVGHSLMGLEIAHMHITTPGNYTDGWDQGGVGIYISTTSGNSVLQSWFHDLVIQNHLAGINFGGVVYQCRFERILISANTPATGLPKGPTNGMVTGTFSDITYNTFSNIEVTNVMNGGYSFYINSHFSDFNQLTMDGPAYFNGPSSTARNVTCEAMTQTGSYPQTCVMNFTNFASVDSICIRDVPNAKFGIGIYIAGPGVKVSGIKIYNSGVGQPDTPLYLAGGSSGTIMSCRMVNTPATNRLSAAGLEGFVAIDMFDFTDHTLTASNIKYFGTTLLNYANDAAAAAGGVAVGQLYRNGSDVFVRVT